MENTRLHKEMIDFYNEKSFTHNYIFGFTYKENAYMFHCTSEMLPYLTKLDTASRGAGVSLRFKPNNSLKRSLIDMGAKAICSSVYFYDRVVNSEYNRGEVFEQFIAEMNGQEWTKDHVPFTDDGDITVNGIAYQLKFERATFISEAQMMRMRARA